MFLALMHTVPAAVDSAPCPAPPRSIMLFGTVALLLKLPLYRLAGIYVLHNRRTSVEVTHSTNQGRCLSPLV